jgi:hypothetical protein
MRISQTAVFLKYHTFRRHLAHGGNGSLMITAFHIVNVKICSAVIRQICYFPLLRLSCLHHVIWLPVHQTAYFSFSFVFL